MLLRDSEYKGNITWDKVTLLAKLARGEDELGYRGEFIRLVNSAKLLDQSKLQEKLILRKTKAYKVYRLLLYF